MVRMDRVQSNSCFTLKLGWVVSKGLVVSHPATSLAGASFCWLRGSPCLEAGSTLLLHQAFNCFLALRVAVGAVVGPMGTEYLAVSQAGKTVPSSHCICFTTGKPQELPVEFQCPVQPSDASESWELKACNPPRDSVLVHTGFIYHLRTKD